jgi:multidrug efflux pump subunit AcrB
VDSNRCGRLYEGLLRTLIRSRFIFIPAFLLVCISAAPLLPWLGRDFFPSVDSGQMLLHFRAQTGTRIEDTAMLADLIGKTIRQQIPSQELADITDNIGLPYSQLNYLYGSSGTIGASDADVLVTLNAKHHPTADYVRTLRTILTRQFPGTTFYFLPADMVTQILNFGLPAPVDV